MIFCPKTRVLNGTQGRFPAVCDEQNTTFLSQNMIFSEL